MLAGCFILLRFGGCVSQVRVLHHWRVLAVSSVGRATDRNEAAISNIYI